MFNMVLKCRTDQWNLKRWLFLLNGWLILMLRACSGSPYKQYTMDAICASDISMVPEQIYGADISMTITSKIKAQHGCNLTIQSRNDMPYLNFEFTELSLPSCDRSQLHILTGSFSTLLTPYTELSQLCGSSANQNIGVSFESAAKYLVLQFTLSKGGGNVAGSFRMIVNAYKDGGACSRNDDEFTCDNNKCVHSDLTCQNYNPCGDQSDCVESTSANEDDTNLLQWLPITVFVIFSVIIVLLFLRFWIKDFGSGSNCNGICECIGDCMRSICEGICSCMGHCASGIRGFCRHIPSCICGVRERCQRIPAVCADHVHCSCKCPCRTVTPPDSTQMTEVTTTTTATTTATTPTTTSSATNTDDLDNIRGVDDPPPPYVPTPSAPPMFSDITGDRPPDYNAYFGARGIRDSSDPPPNYDMVMEKEKQSKA